MRKIEVAAEKMRLRFDFSGHIVNALKKIKKML